MAYKPNPNDPFITPPSDDDFPGRIDPLMPSDRYDDKEPMSLVRFALGAVMVLSLIGALFYGMSTATNDEQSAVTRQFIADAKAGKVVGTFLEDNDGTVYIVQSDEGKSLKVLMIKQLSVEKDNLDSRTLAGIKRVVMPTDPGNAEMRDRILPPPKM